MYSPALSEKVPPWTGPRVRILELPHGRLHADEHENHDEQALREEVLDEIVAERSDVPSDATVPPAQEPAVQPTVAGEEYLSSVLKMSGLTDSDPDVIELLRKERDPFKRIAAIGELTETRKQAQTTPARAGATLPSGAGETVPAEESLETITEQLNAELAKPKKDFQKLKELGKKHKELLPTE